MRTVFEIARTDLRIIFQDRSIWLNIVVIPVILSFVVGFANGAGATAPPTTSTLLVDVLDNDSSDRSAQFFDEVRAANATIVLCPLDNTDDDICQLAGAALDETLAESRLSSQEALALIEIPAGFGAQIDAGEPVAIGYRSSEDAFAPSFILQAVQSAAQQIGGTAIAATVGTQVADDIEYLLFVDDADRAAFTETIRSEAASIWATDPVNVEYTASDFDSETLVNRGGGGFSQSIPGMATMYVMFAIFPAAAALIRERQQWTLQRLATMPVSRAQILGGKMLARFALGIVQYAIIFAFGVFLGVRYGNDPIALALLMATFTLCITALTLALTTVLRNEAQAAGVALFLSLTLAPLGGAWWPLDIVPDWMRTVGHLSPVAWVMDGYRSLIFLDGNLGTVIVPLLVLLGLTVVFFVIGVRRFQYS
ncbi:MAG: ABC transporter permease [Chloroflexi bacterium]|nr:ABC transporter permease [Chloroflexota bacterium]